MWQILSLLNIPKEWDVHEEFFSEIIEIGAVKIDGISLAVTGKIQNFVHPQFLSVSRLKREWIFV